MKIQAEFVEVKPPKQAAQEEPIQSEVMLIVTAESPPPPPPLKTVEIEIPPESSHPNKPHSEYANLHFQGSHSERMVSRNIDQEVLTTRKHSDLQ